MLQVLATQFGGPEVLTTRRAPDPVAGPGQVVVDAAVADTLFIDTQIRRGWGREHFTVQPPYVPGNGVAGVVSSVGGPALSDSQKFRNIKADPRVSFLVDDIAPAEESVGPGSQRGRGLEIRGWAETLVVDEPLMDGFTNDVIRIHPRRVVAWNLDGPGPNIRDVR